MAISSGSWQKTGWGWRRGKKFLRWSDQDDYRDWLCQDHLRELHRAIQDGANCKGWLWVSGPLLVGYWCGSMATRTAMKAVELDPESENGLKSAIGLQKTKPSQWIWRLNPKSQHILFNYWALHCRFKLGAKQFPNGLTLNYSNVWNHYDKKTFSCLEDFLKRLCLLSCNPTRPVLLNFPG